MLGFFGCLGNPHSGREEKRCEYCGEERQNAFKDIKPMSKREESIWRCFGIAVFAVFLFFSLLAIVLFLLGLGSRPS